MTHELTCEASHTHTHTHTHNVDNTISYNIITTWSWNVCLRRNPLEGRSCSHLQHLQVVLSLDITNRHRVACTNTQRSTRAQKNRRDRVRLLPLGRLSLPCHWVMRVCCTYNTWLSLAFPRFNQNRRVQMLAAYRQSRCRSRRPGSDRRSHQNRKSCPHHPTGKRTRLINT